MSRSTNTATVTLSEAAERLGVHYMTVYRYVRLGRLPARKVDGIWQIDVADLADFQMGAAETSSPGVPADWARRLEARLIEGDEAGAWAVVESALASGTEPADIYVRLLGPALTSVGERWREGGLSAATEHIASAVSARIIGRLGPRFHRRGRSRGVALVVTPQGERHAMPSAMLADLFRGAGFDVIDLGTDVPPDDLPGVIEGIDSLSVVCVSVTAPDSDRQVRRTVQAIRGSTDALLLVGGGAVRDAAHAEAMGADAWAPDGVGAVRLALEHRAAS